MVLVLQLFQYHVNEIENGVLAMQLVVIGTWIAMAIEAWVWKNSDLLLLQLQSNAFIFIFRVVYEMEWTQTEELNRSRSQLRFTRHLKPCPSDSEGICGGQQCSLHSAENAHQWMAGKAHAILGPWSLSKPQQSTSRLQSKTSVTEFQVVKQTEEQL